MNFLIEEVEENKEEIKDISKDSELCVSKIYSFLNKLDGVKKISIRAGYGFRDDGRKEKRICLELDNDSDIEEVLEKIIEKFDSIYEIKIEEITDGYEKNYNFKNDEPKEFKIKKIELCIYKKFTAEKIEAKILQTGMPIPTISPSTIEAINKIIPI
jgi:hypothetical protein